MDIHDFEDVARNYDLYVQGLVAQDGAAGSRVIRDDVVPFHLDLAARYGQRGILYLGCGTGAVLLPLIEAGHHVVGVDVSPPMLNVLRERLDRLDDETRSRARLECADMKDLSLEEAFSLVIAPRSPFLHLLTPEAQEGMLRSAHRHLTDDGILSFNSFDPNYRLIADNLKGSSPDPVCRGEYVNADGHRERIWQRGEYDPATQVFDGAWIFEELDEAGQPVSRRERPLRTRWTFVPELLHLLRLCGFEVVSRYGGYDHRPTQYGGWIVWVVRKV